VIIGDDKNGGVVVWSLAGERLQVIDGGTAMNNLDLRGVPARRPVLHR